MLETLRTKVTISGFNANVHNLANSEFLAREVDKLGRNFLDIVDLRDNTLVTNMIENTDGPVTLQTTLKIGEARLTITVG